MPLTTGARLGVYEIGSLLGSGGMGEVYRARDTKLWRDVALKVLPDSLACDPERLARLEREAHLLAALNHPAIAHIYGIEDSTGTLERFQFVCSNTVAAVPDVVRALIRQKQCESGTDQLADVLEGAWTNGAEERLEFREREFDWVEIGTVRREKAQVRTGLLDGKADLGLLVGGEIVEHDHIAAAQRGHEDLLHIGPERDVIDRAVKHGRGRQLGRAQRRDHRVGVPVAARRVIRDARAAQTTGIAAEQIGGDARFVDEHVGAGIVKRQQVGPPTARGRDVSATLFGCVYGFF
jgi:hypothetical protein